MTVDRIQMEIAIKHDKARQEIADITEHLAAQAQPQAEEGAVVQPQPLRGLRPPDPPPHRRHERRRAPAHPWDSAKCERQFCQRLMNCVHTQRKKTLNF